MTDREALMAMLRRAEKLQPRPPGDAQGDWLYLREGRTAVKFMTGPDDASATFTFGEDGMLAHVSVDESSQGDPL